MAKPRIVVVGSANVDLTTFTDRFPQPGETIFGEAFDLGFGGKGANQAVAAKLCGADVAMVARVGGDLFGPATVDNFEKLGIDASHVRVTEGISSGVAPIFVERSGQNRIIVVKGANDHLKPEDVDRAAPILKRADCIVLQFEIPLETVRHAVGWASRHGVRCILNPAPALPVDVTSLAEVDYFIPNESEAEAIGGRPVGTPEQAVDCAHALRRRGLRRVTITLGKRGACHVGPEGEQRIPAFEVESKDTTGAGDAFIGSLAVFLAEGAPEAQALARASLYAALSTKSVGTQKSFLNREDFEREWRARSSVAFKK